MQLPFLALLAAALVLAPTTRAQAGFTYDGNAGGAACVFPFVYNDVTYNECTDADNGGVLWCSTTGDYVNDGLWGNCISECTALNCGDLYEGCFKDTSDRMLPDRQDFGGALTPAICIAHCQGRLGHTNGGNGDGAPCVFPFVYNDVTYNECTDVGNNGVLWCSTTADYMNDGRWGNCISYAYAGSQNHKECWCGDEIRPDSLLSDEECRDTCDGDRNLMCGGQMKLSVYSIAVTPDYPYEGCFNDDQRMLPDRHDFGDTLTPTICAVHCQGLGYAYAGSQYSYQCWCGDDLQESWLVGDEECGMTCEGDRDLICGDGNRNSVYSTAAADCFDDPIFDHHVEGSDGESGIEIVEDCKDFCEANPDCTGLDWSYGENPYQNIRCWLHYQVIEDRDIVPSGSSVNFYKRREGCP